MDEQFSLEEGSGALKSLTDFHILRYKDIRTLTLTFITLTLTLTLTLVLGEMTTIVWKMEIGGNIIYSVIYVILVFIVY